MPKSDALWNLLDDAPKPKSVAAPSEAEAAAMSPDELGAVLFDTPGVDPAAVKQVSPIVLATLRKRYDAWNLQFAQEMILDAKLKDLIARIERGKAYIRQHPDDARAQPRMREVQAEYEDVKRQIIQQQFATAQALKAFDDLDLALRAKHDGLACLHCGDVLRAATAREHWEKCTKKARRDRQ